MNMHLQKIGVFVGSLVLGFAFAYWFDAQNLSRNPAAIRQYYDFSNLRGSALEVALKERVVSQIELVRGDKDLGLKLGHFAFTNPQDEKKMGCSEYTKVTLQFESADMAVSGEKSVMEVEGQCEASKDATMIETVWIPLSKIYGEKPGDGNFQFPEQQNISVHFTNVSDSWPQQWHLVGVRLHSMNKIGDIAVDRNEMQKILGKPFVLVY